MTEELLDKLAIRELLENWAVWRDAGYWERFRTVWHDDGFMMATWWRCARSATPAKGPRRYRCRFS